VTLFERRSLRLDVTISSIFFLFLSAITYRESFLSIGSENSMSHEIPMYIALACILHTNKKDCFHSLSISSYNNRIITTKSRRIFSCKSFRILSFIRLSYYKKIESLRFEDKIFNFRNCKAMNILSSLAAKKHIIFSNLFS